MPARFSKVIRSVRITTTSAALCGVAALSVAALQSGVVAEAESRVSGRGHPAVSGDITEVLALRTGQSAGLAAAQVERQRRDAASRSALRSVAAAERARAAAAAERARAAAAAARAAEAVRAARAARAAEAARQAVRSALSDPQAAARVLVAERGWGSGQFSCLVSLWNRESGWNYRASNPSSGAYGIPQALPGGKMSSAGADWRTNPVTQIRWGLGYIAKVYGTPCGAWGHSQATGWY